MNEEINTETSFQEESAQGESFLEESEQEDLSLYETTLEEMELAKAKSEERYETLGIIAGGGQFPRLIAEEARKNGQKVFICGFHDNTNPELADYCDDFTILPLGQLGKLFKFFKNNHVQHLCLAGTINKPKALSLRPDFRATKLLFSLKTKGDDVLLRAILKELETEGFIPLSAADLIPSLRTPVGNLTGKNIPQQIKDDIAFGVTISKQIGKFDIGQCIVVRNGIVMAVESLEGTDAAIKRGAELGGYNCTAIKRSKPKQDVRVDLPCIGLTTIETLIAHDYRAIAVEAYHTLFFDREKAIKLAKKHNLHILAIN